MEVAYSGMTIAMVDTEPFCVDARGEKLITAAASPLAGVAGLACLLFLQERMDSDRRPRRRGPAGGGLRLQPRRGGWARNVLFLLHQGLLASSSYCVLLVQ